MMSSLPQEDKIHPRMDAPKSPPVLKVPEPCWVLWKSRGKFLSSSLCGSVQLLFKVLPRIEQKAFRKTASTTDAMNWPRTHVCIHMYIQHSYTHSEIHSTHTCTFIHIYLSTRHIQILNTPHMQTQHILGHLSCVFLLCLPVLLRYNRHTALYAFKAYGRRFDLHTSWSDCHGNFSEHPSSQVDTKLKKQKKFSLWR